MSDDDRIFTDEEISERVSKLAQQNVQFADPLNLNQTYIRSLLVYMIENIDGLSMADAEQHYFRTMNNILTNAERATTQARILGGIVPSQNGHS